MSHFWWNRGRSQLGGDGGEQQSTFKVFCKADEGRCLAIRDGALVLTPADPADEHQHWFKDARLSLCVKDEEGNPVFSLVNKATGLTVQHSLGPYRPVRLVKFNPDRFDQSVLWTESGHLGRYFGCIRMMHDIDLGLDALPSDLDGGGVRDHTTITLTEWAERDTQRWKILNWNDKTNTTLAGLEAEPSCRIYCKVEERLSVTVRNGAVCLAPTDPNDKYQHWIQDKRPGNRVKDVDAYPAFALINKVMGDAIKGCKSMGHGHPLKLVPYNPFYLDISVLWTTSHDMGHGFSCIHLVDRTSLGFEGVFDDNTSIVLSEDCPLVFCRG
nr:ricin B-like lectin R40C1 [Setaria viridis]